jgi:hypothetical protein
MIAGYNSLFPMFNSLVKSDRAWCYIISAFQISEMGVSISKTDKQKSFGISLEKTLTVESATDVSLAVNSDESQPELAISCPEATKVQQCIQTDKDSDGSYQCYLEVKNYKLEH